MFGELRNAFIVASPFLFVATFMYFANLTILPEAVRLFCVWAMGICAGAILVYPMISYWLESMIKRKTNKDSVK